MAKEKKQTVDLIAKQQAFRDALATIDKNFKGKVGSTEKEVGLLTELVSTTEMFSSGSIVLDNILGGGIPKGRIIEIYGAEASGKTSIALTAIAQIQREGGNCVFLDVEQAFDKTYAKKLGVDIENLGFAQPSVAEHTMSLLMEIVNSGQVDLVVLDSVPAMVPLRELEADLEKASVAELPRLLSKALRILIKQCKENNCTVIFLNQIRDNVGVMYGPATTTSGGKALKFYASQRIQISKASQPVKDGSKEIGTEVTMKVIKNKVAPPFGVGKTVLTFSNGISRAAEVATVAEEKGVIKKEGRTYYYPNGNESLIRQDGPSAITEDKGLKVAVNTSGLIAELEENELLFNALSKEISEVIQKELNS